MQALFQLSYGPKTESLKRQSFWRLAREKLPELGENLSALGHGGEVFPFDGPGAVLGEAGGVDVWRFVPAGGHHGDGDENSAVSGEIEAEAVVLVVVAVGEVSVLGDVEEKGLDGELGFAEAGGGHGDHGIVPTPGVLPVVGFENVDEGLSEALVVDFGAWEHAFDSEDDGVVPWIPDALGGGVHVFVVGQGGEFAEDFVPVGSAFLSLADAPLLGDFESPAPIGELEGGIAGDAVVVAFLGGYDGGTEVVVACLFVEVREGCHERGGALYDLVVFLQGGLVGVGSVAELRVIDGVWLLPEEKWRDGGGNLVAGGIYVFWPAYAGVALGFCDGFGFGDDLLVPGQGVFEEGQAIPEGEVDAVPPVHFEVGLAVPAIDGEAGLLRGIFAAALDGGEVLGEDYASLYFAGAGIGAA